MDFYDIESITQIVTRGARIIETEIVESGAVEIARRSRGTPRVALRMLRRVRDYAQVRGDGKIDLATAQAALDLLEIDQLGLDDLDRRVLTSIVENFNGGPVGLETIGASISEEGDTIMDVVEPYLLQLGFIARTARGRVATQKAYKHLGVTMPDNAAGGPQQQTLFPGIDAG